jgi:hypothetical protein
MGSIYDYISLSIGIGTMNIVLIKQLSVFPESPYHLQIWTFYAFCFIPCNHPYLAWIRLEFCVNSRRFLRANYLPGMQLCDWRHLTLVPTSSSGASDGIYDSFRWYFRGVKYHRNDCKTPLERMKGTSEKTRKWLHLCGVYFDREHDIILQPLALYHHPLGETLTCP